MTKTEYEKIRARIDHRYQTDVAALERIWHEFNGDDEEPPTAPGPEVPKTKSRRQGKLSDEEKRARNKAYMKAYLARRKAGLVGAGRRKRHNDDERGVKNFNKFLVAGPLSAAGNGQ